MKFPKFWRGASSARSKSLIVLGVALVLGAIAALAARNYLVGRMADIEARSQGKTVNIVVAKTDLPIGTKLSSDNVAVRPIPADYAHSAAVLPDQFDRIAGEKLAFGVKGGEMILWSLTEAKRRPTFSVRVEAGHRALTVPVDEINSISGMLEPGDVIDLMVTLDRKDKKINFPLLQHVQVLATGTRAVDDPKSGERRSYSTVTLDTTPEEAQHVIVARETGRITALLRNPQDGEPLPGPKVDVAALLGLKAAPSALPAGESTVPVLYGNRPLPEMGLKLSGHSNPSTPVPLTAALANVLQPAQPGAPGDGSAPRPQMDIR